MIKYMLDTNICIYTIKNNPQTVRECFEAHYGQLCISSVALMELRYGAERSGNPQRNHDIIDGLAARLCVLPFDDGAANHAAQIRAALSHTGKPIGAYDALIAGHARSTGLILVSNNLREFDRVDGLRTENWI
ncbi:type II toxin-antitoxin system tRNA(fMet)-specific endonuclease VapC [Conchiformibius kuhniae]|uniref:Ribonuclease VapC n=1 Tax=Conchiformibius kuhniae TaxID=211502 RepID=A0A8T9MWQ4_9NEIS|nr:tRNA(fMet)-specific endonuclease VapC [Conchiformibius kuhniae]UOP05584.1 tRNA(fMet)-specific endonuclease VapC [Conchiformibius kuhniae]